MEAQIHEHKFDNGLCGCFSACGTCKSEKSLVRGGFANLLHRLRRLLVPLHYIWQDCVPSGKPQDVDISNHETFNTNVSAVEPQNLSVLSRHLN